MDKVVLNKLKKPAAVVGLAAGAALLLSTTASPHDFRLPAKVALKNPLVKQSNINKTICIPGWSDTQRPAGSVTEKIKIRLENQIGFHGEAELDHAIPISLGGWGGGDGMGLWIEPQPRARVVDQIEIQLHRDVCAGKITLSQAQKQIISIKKKDG